MKKIIIKSLTLTNWRGERSRTTNFNPVSTTIAGANGLGKSRHFDAFMWLLFGKDSQDRKDFNIKTVVDGEPLMKTECEVAGLLNVDGEDIVLRRAFVEDWVKPRGQEEQVFKGNKTECYWNDTPVNVSEYQKRISSIIDDSVFKMVTNPSYFPNMQWKAQRDQLFLLAGTISDDEIANGVPGFTALLDRIKGKSLSDFKKELSARKKRLRADLDEIQPRIDQTRKLMPAPSDFQGLESELKQVEAEIAETDKAISDVSERMSLAYEGVRGKQVEIETLKLKRRDLVFSSEEKAKEQARNANARRTDLKGQIDSLTRETERLKEEVRKMYIERADRNFDIKKMTEEADTLREKWYRVNKSEFDGETKCPVCGQELPEEMKSEKVEVFNRHKQAELQEITRKGQKYRSEIERNEEACRKIDTEAQKLKDVIQSKGNEIKTLTDELAQTEEVKPVVIVPEHTPGYQELTDRISALEKACEEEKAGQVHTDSTDAYKSKRKELEAKRDEVKTKLSDRERIAQFEKQIEDLEAKGKDLAQQIANAEREEYTIQQFTRAKVEECEKRINGLFSMVTFRLFDYTIEDAGRENPIETCVPLVDGVPYPVANSAGKLNAGLDIINVLTRFYGVSAPIFIDNREGVNEIIETESQVINLEVTKDKELIIR